jgi:uncharacterized membrane protein YfcA
VRLERALTARLVLIGLVAGVFSAVFGVGGGIILVPLLIGFVAFPIREATATSLGAILVTATAGVALYAVRGDVRIGYAALVGLPAVLGALVGTQIQQRVSGRGLTLGFAVLLAVVGVWLIAG